MIPLISKLMYRPSADNAQHPRSDRGELGVQAKRLLDDPVLALAFERIERDLVARWKNTAVGAAPEREAAYHLQWALQSLKSQLRALLNDAKLIEAEDKRRRQMEEAEARRHQPPTIGD